MDLDVRTLRYLVAAYEEGSISRASERENIVQPALSVRIKQLEIELSVRLFERSAQGLQPTPAGHLFYKLCMSLLQQLRDARQQMLDFGGTIAGSVRVGLMPSICRGLLGRIRAAFSDAFPAVDLAIVEATSGTLVQQVIAEQLDIAICNQPASQTDLKLRLLFKDRVVLASGSAKVLEPGRSCRLRDLAGLKLVLPSRGNSIRRALDAHFKLAELVPARFVEIDGLGATMRFIAHSDWSTTVPSVAVLDDAASPAFILNPITEPQITSDIYAMHLPGRRPSLVAQAFVDLVEAYLKGREAAWSTDRLVDTEKLSRVEARLLS